MIRTIKIDDINIDASKPVICVPAVGRSINELINELKTLNKSCADIIEWRADFIQEDILETLKIVYENIGDKKLLFTFRTLEQGGENECENYFELLEKVIESGLIHAIDIEICNNKSQIADIIYKAKQKNITTIISSHYFDNTPNMLEIENEYDEMQNLGADIPKIAVMPQNFTDVTQFMQTVYEESLENSPIIGISMGELGSVTRLCSKHMGSCLSFAAGVNASAPGQLKSSFVKEFMGE